MLDAEKATSLEMKLLIESFSAEDSLSSSLDIIKNIPKDQMYTLIWEELRQNAKSTNIDPFMNRIESTSAR